MQAPRGRLLVTSRPPPGSRGHRRLGQGLARKLPPWWLQLNTVAGIAAFRRTWMRRASFRAWPKTCSGAVCTATPL